MINDNKSLGTSGIAIIKFLCFFFKCLKSSSKLTKKTKNKKKNPKKPQQSMSVKCEFYFKLPVNENEEVHVIILLYLYT